MNVLTISTLQNKGGAAYIAKTLHKGFEEHNINTKYLVGYGKRGFKEKNVDEKVFYADYTLPIIPHLNLLTHSVFGKDIFSPQKEQIENLINWSDVIICHTLHSYFINFEFLFDLFQKYGGEKKVIFVGHDSWHYTGRCAFIYDCELWKTGCQKCPNTQFYPPTKFSISKSERAKKISKISNIPNLTFVSPAKWICNDLKEVYPHVEVEVIRNAIDINPFKKITRNYSKANEIEVCVSSVDLSQEGKVDLKLVENLLNLGVTIHFIGKNNPFSNHPNAVNHGYISNREDYIEILKNVDCYLFSSTIDIYPTVLVDALCAGNFIFYTKSKGSLEIMEAENSWLAEPVVSAEEIVNILKSKKFKLIIMDKVLRETKRKEALTFYNKNRMVKEYIRLF
jgi:putative colanic acid biosynthesis glycosyltransferase